MLVNNFIFSWSVCQSDCLLHSAIHPSPHQDTIAIVYDVFQIPQLPLNTCSIINSNYTTTNIRSKNRKKN